MLTAAQQESLLRLILAFVSGGILGFERSRKGIDAGFRTHIFVCMSSCAIMLTNIHVYLLAGTGDPVRMPAQVISGVGFLGAGCILVTGQRRIKGVTTAAGLWSAACLGLCIGAGDYVVALAVLAIALLTMTVLRSVDDKLASKTKYMRFYVEVETVAAMTNFMKFLRSRRAKVLDVELLDNKVSDSVAVIVSFKLEKAEAVEQVRADIEKEQGVFFASKI